MKCSTFFRQPSILINFLINFRIKTEKDPEIKLTISQNPIRALM